MTTLRWKVLACTLGLSVGGLAVFAGQPNNMLDKSDTPSAPPIVIPTPTIPPIADKPVTPSSAPDTLPPLTIPVTSSQPTTPAAPAVPAVQEFELQIPAATAPSTPQVQVIIPVAVNTQPEQLPMPREVSSVPPANPLLTSVPPLEIASRTSTVVPMDRTPVPMVPPVAPNQTVPLETPEVPSMGTTQPIPQPLTPLPSQPEARRTTVPPPVPLAPAPVDPPVAVTPPAPHVAQAPKAEPAKQPVVNTAKLKMLLRMGVGTPRFEIRTSDTDELLLKVYAEKIEMQAAPEGVKASPLAGVTAIGKVKFSGPGVEGTCEQLTILSGTGEVLLKGNVHMKTRLRSRNWSEMTADKMIYQIGATGLTAKASTSTVVPIGFATQP